MFVTEQSIALAKVLYSIRLDYCNSLFLNVTQKELNILQRVQNIISQALRSLRFKYNMLTYKALRTSLPAYLREHLKPYECSKGTRRSDPELMYLGVQGSTVECAKNKTHLFKAICVTG